MAAPCSRQGSDSASGWRARCTARRSWPGNQLSSSWFFKGSGADGNGAGALSGIYVNTFNGQIWYNPTTAAGGDSALWGRVAVATAPTLDATDFVYGV